MGRREMRGERRETRREKGEETEREEKRESGRSTRRHSGQAVATVSSALTITHLRICLAAVDPLAADTAAGVGDPRRVRRNRRCDDATRIDLLLHLGLPRHVARGAAS